MAVIYYPKNQLLYVRDTVVSASNYESVVLAVSPNTVLYFDTSSAVTAASAMNLAITASWASQSLSSSYYPSNIIVDSRLNLPATAMSNGMYICTDSDFTYVASASVWKSKYRGRNVTEPTESGFGWVSGGTGSTSNASTTSSFGGLYLYCGPDAVNNNRCYTKFTSSAAPWTWTVRMYPYVPELNYTSFGIVLRESSTGKMMLFGLQWNGEAATNDFYLIVIGISNTLGGGLVDYTPAAKPIWRNHLFTGGEDAFTLEIKDDGAGGNLSYRHYVSGPAPFNYVSHARTTYFTAGPDQIGYFINPRNATYSLANWIVSSTL